MKLKYKLLGVVGVSAFIFGLFNLQAFANYYYFNATTQPSLSSTPAQLDSAVNGLVYSFTPQGVRPVTNGSWPFGSAVTSGTSLTITNGSNTVYQGNGTSPIVYGTGNPNAAGPGIASAPGTIDVSKGLQITANVNGNGNIIGAGGSVLNGVALIRPDGSSVTYSVSNSGGTINIPGETNCNGCSFRLIFSPEDTGSGPSSPATCTGTVQYKACSSSSCTLQTFNRDDFFSDPNSTTYDPSLGCPGSTDLCQTDADCATDISVAINPLFQSMVLGVDAYTTYSITYAKTGPASLDQMQINCSGGVECQLYDSSGAQVINGAACGYTMNSPYEITCNSVNYGVLGSWRSGYFDVPLDNYTVLAKHTDIGNYQIHARAYVSPHPQNACVGTCDHSETATLEVRNAVCTPTTFNSAQSGVSLSTSTFATNLNSVNPNQDFYVSCNYGVNIPSNVTINAGPADCSSAGYGFKWFLNNSGNIDSVNGQNVVFKCKAPATAQNFQVSCNLNQNYEFCQNSQANFATVNMGACTNGATQACGSGTCAGVQTCTAGVWGACSYAATNGTSCDDGVACSYNSTCNNGVCTNATNYSCSAPNACQSGGACTGNSPGTCAAFTNLAAGTACPGGTCNGSGVCVGTSAPAIGLSPTVMTFNATAGGAAPAAQNLTITNTGTAGSQLLWRASTNQSWCHVGTASGGPLAQNANTTVAITVDAPASPGSQSCLVTIQDNGSSPAASNSPQYLTVWRQTAPNAPADLAVNLGPCPSRTTTLTWTAAAGATSYNIYRSTTNDPATTGAPIKTAVSSPTTDSPTTNASTYYYWVSAVGGSQESAKVASASNSTGIQVEQCLTGPNNTANFNSSSDATVSCETIKVSWTLPFSGNPLIWSFKKKITIDRTKVVGGSDLTNFPFLFSVSGGDYRFSTYGGQIGKADATDIYFTSSDGTTKLSHKIEKYDPATGELAVWIKVPTLSASANTVLYMYLGNPAVATDQQDMDNSHYWDTNYKGVWHLPNGSTLSATDSSQSANNGTILGATAAVGKMGGGAGFAGGGQVINIANNASLQSQTFTYQAWVKNTSAGYHPIIAQSGGSGPEWRVNSNNTMSLLRTGTQNLCTSTGTVPLNTWTQVAVTYNGSTCQFYINGVSAGSTSISSSFSFSTFWIGGAGGVNEYFVGEIDEVRMSDVLRSANLLQTEYNNQGSPSTFYAVTDEPGANSGGPLGYKIYHNTTNNFATATLRQSVGPGVLVWTETNKAFMDPVNNYYWVEAWNNASAAQSLALPSPIAYISCDANLTTSDKDIIALNDVSPYGSSPRSDCSSPGETPPNVAYKINDKITYQICVKNTAPVLGGNPATSINISERLTNLARVDTSKSVTDPLAWGMSLSGAGFSLGSITASGTEPNLTLSIPINGSLAPSSTTTPVVVKLFISGKTQLPAGYSANTSRFQNSAAINFIKDGINPAVKNVVTPLLLFNKVNAPIKTEIP